MSRFSRRSVRWTALWRVRLMAEAVSCWGNSRPPLIPVEKKLGTELSVLQGETPIAQTARRRKVFDEAIGYWSWRSSKGENAATGAVEQGQSGAAKVALSTSRS